MKITLTELVTLDGVSQAASDFKKPGTRAAHRALSAGYSWAGVGNAISVGLAGLEPTTYEV